jgi:hypothetical protein
MRFPAIAFCVFLALIVAVRAAEMTVEGQRLVATLDSMHV